MSKSFFMGKVPSKQRAVKMHTLLNVRGNIPCFIHITDGSCHDVNALDFLPVEQGANCRCKKKLNMEQSLYTIPQTLNLCLFEKTPINQLFEKQIYKFKDQDDYNQLKMFEL